MATPARSFPAETFYHIYNRGNRKQLIFLQPRDYARFLSRLLKYKKEYSINLLAHCLMPNHFHFLIRQPVENTLPKFMLKLCTSYAKYSNIKYEQPGRLFQDRFKAKLVGNERYLLWLSKYIHLNPVEILPKDAVLQSYPWSSYKEYVTETPIRITDPTMVLSYFSLERNSQLNYQTFVENGLTTEELDTIRDLAIDL